MILFLAIINSIFCYTPHSHFILEKVSENNGKSSYRVVQESLFQNSKERILVQETWTIDEGLTMHLEAKGPGISFTAKYDFNSRYTLNDDENIVSERLAAGFVDSLYYLKTAKDIANRIYQLKISGSDILRPQKRFYSLEQVEYKGQNFVSLDKFEGDVAYKIHDSNKASDAGLWISQNDFHILKIAFSNGDEILHSDFQKFSKNLFLAKERVFTWNNNKTPIRLLQVNSIDLGTNEKQVLNKNTKAGLSKNSFGSSSLSRAIRAFYSQFR